jgi:hypothetical protein
MNAYPQGWTLDRLKDVSAINASSLPANTDGDYEFDYLEISNVNYHGIVDPKAIERLRYEDAPSRARRRLAKNCTAISSVRPNLQAVAFIERAGRFGVFHWLQCCATCCAQALAEVRLLLTPRGRSTAIL